MCFGRGIVWETWKSAEKTSNRRTDPPKPSWENSTATLTKGKKSMGGGKLLKKKGTNGVGVQAEKPPKSHREGVPYHVSLRGEKGV